MLGSYDVYALWSVHGVVFADELSDGDREFLLKRVNGLFVSPRTEQRPWSWPGPDEGRSYSAITVPHSVNPHGDEVSIPTWMLAGGFAG
jgi:hypothetical protein